MQVQYAKVGTAVLEIDLEEGAKLVDLLEQQGDVETTSEVRVNNEVVPTDHVLNEADIITLVPAIKGGGGIQ